MTQPGNIFHPLTQVYEKGTWYSPDITSRVHDGVDKFVKNGENMREKWETVNHVLG
jgi:hypothetical protein